MSCCKVIKIWRVLGDNFFFILRISLKIGVWLCFWHFCTNIFIFCRRRELRAMRWAKIPAMTFPIKNIIYTELFNESNEGLYIQKGDKETDQQNIRPLRRGLNWNGGKSKAGMKTRPACLEWLTLHGKKDKLTPACLKRLSLKSEKISYRKK